MALLGEILLKEGGVSEQQLDVALREQKRTKELLGNVLVRLGILSEKKLSRIIAQNSDIPYVDLKQTQIDPAAVQLIDGKLARQFTFMPLSLVNDSLHVVMDNPNDVTAVDTIIRATGLDVDCYASDRLDILDAIEFYYDVGATLDEEIDRNVSAALNGGMDGDLVIETPISRLVDLFLTKGLQKSATDIHISAEKKSVRVSYRVDGILQSDSILPSQLHISLLTRIKIMTGMDIAEQRLPQDGGMSFEFLGRNVDIRAAVSPGIHGENIALRILDRGNVALEFNRLGLNKNEQDLLNRLSRLPYGMVLMAGPTGSGKTTTLYSILKGINALEKNIMTIEDPVEYELPVIKQTHLNPQVGLTFDKAIRHFLRMDPDILLVGEIRDLETSRAAFQAAMTGHLVFSTIHTNSAAATVARLLDLGVELYYIPSTVRAIIAQRLIRQLCRVCREEYIPDKEELARYDLTDWKNAGKPVFRAKGCEKCNHTGYLGRSGIFEIMEITPAINQAISKKLTPDELEKIARSNGMTTLRESGLEKVSQGFTTLEEIARVTL
ncbi:GspE/PulE family protein [Desulfobacula phenolica]|uniref:Type IV pilus assembly protein PilB n=1 Tax=Desulfobacula phenolica TaxID=90732 RepID=A0A1H2J0B3_9BACT|nr:ATPase, T2SS/T4P/T4SS family [Desulfobacula phenolica]SDU49843.1 type IV pilus assembly protein PilB [Desulfobacula phenolica]